MGNYTDVLHFTSDATVSGQFITTQPWRIIEKCQRMENYRFFHDIFESYERRQEMHGSV